MRDLSIATVGGGTGGLTTAATLGSARSQAISHATSGMKGGDDDTSLLYGYGAWSVSLSLRETDVPAR